MITLSRAVRFSINDPSDAPHADPWGRPDNTFAAYPSMVGLGRHYELFVTCRGRIDPDTGYFLNIKAIDNAVRLHAIPLLAPALAPPSPPVPSGSATPPPPAPITANDPAHLLAMLLRALHAPLRGSVDSLLLRLSPYHSIEMSSNATSIALLRQQFEFAASHRLHIPTLSDEQNRALFGKCTHPSGHGHNYRVEPCVEIPAHAPQPPQSTPAATQHPSPVFTLQTLERLTREIVIDRFDHKHLNLDCSEFAAPHGVNPSVENIARVCYELLAPAVARAAASDPSGVPPARLRHVTVWETDKTCATYPG